MKLNNKFLIVAMGLALVFAGGAVAQTTLDVVTNNAANPNPLDASCVAEGEYAMRVTFNTSSDHAFVEADSNQGFNNETVMRASYDINLRDLRVPHRHKFFVHSALPAGAGLRPYQLLVSFNNVNGFKTWCQAAQNNGVIAAGPKVDLDPDNYNRVQVEWAHNEPGETDALCKVTVIGGDSSTLTNFRNTNHTIGRVRMGANGRIIPAMGNAPGRDTMCFDDFQSFRTLAP